jgi:GNAT superfamily N-acetyltransferase
MSAARSVRVAGSDVVLRRAALAEIVALRHAALRPGLPPESAAFDGDDAPDTHHFGAFDGADAVGCLSFMRRDRDGEAHQLRGMATAAALRGAGIGRALLTFAEEALVGDTGIVGLWCNARVESIGFYERLGWAVVSDVFDVPGVGPHRVMVRRRNGQGRVRGRTRPADDQR